MNKVIGSIRVLFYGLLISGCIWWSIIIQHGLGAIPIGSYIILGLVLYKSASRIRDSLVLMKVENEANLEDAKVQINKMLPSK
ncbi:MAG: hypothetical protein ACI8XC_000274 [Gammaproteobacteria bacterium]|jgi:hypothetical protein